jgi:hypothetical protein
MNTFLCFAVAQMLVFAPLGYAQPSSAETASRNSSQGTSQNKSQGDQGALTDHEKLLLDRIADLERRIAALESRSQDAAVRGGAVAAGTQSIGAVNTENPVAVAAPVSAAALSVSPQSSPDAHPAQATFLKDTTVNFYFDGYYAWNTNRPVGRVNLLRAYDVSANSFSINQTGTVIERAADAGAGRRWGYRLDLMYGQATETLQGGAQNELRPQVYRNLFQAYGTYIAPIGKGLTVDFGKWAGSLGAEGNYTKDQINYSRGYFFNFLPFYHEGFRTTYAVNDKLSLTYWLVNGANQTEDFNGFKSQLGQAIIKPSKSVTWTLQYYNGREQRDVVAVLNPGLPTLASQPGLSGMAITPAPRGRFHAIDTYAFWNVNDRLTVGGELSYSMNRVESTGVPQRVSGGAAYLRYQINPKLYFGQRYVRLDDVAGLFSGVGQNLNDITSTLGYRPGDGFETRLEYRRDFSNVPFFLTRTPGGLSKHQDTFSLGLLWWFGGKTGGW